MDEKEKKEVIDEKEPVEQVDEQEPEEKPEGEKKEKKDNAFSRLWNKTKKSINDSILEGKIESAFEKGLPEFKVYEKDSLLSNSVKGKLEDDKLTIFGEKEFKLFAVVMDKDENPFYLTKVEATTVKSTVEEVEYERPGTILTLDKNVEEVNVVKAGKRYFIYKGKDEEKPKEK